MHQTIFIWYPVVSLVVSAAVYDGEDPGSNPGGDGFMHRRIFKATDFNTKNKSALKFKDEITPRGFLRRRT